MCAARAGARAMGELEHSVEHYMKARKHLEYLFDCSDYAVAEGLQGMRYSRLDPPAAWIPTHPVSCRACRVVCHA